MNTYQTSSGERIKKSIIDLNIRRAKILKLDALDYKYCERCGRTDDRLDLSHIISVKECQESGRSELAYDVKNLELLCRKHHLEIEAMSKKEREQFYIDRL